MEIIGIWQKIYFKEGKIEKTRHITSRQPTMRAVSGGWHSPNLRTNVEKKRNNK
jgi:hypothetical protein